MDVHPQPFFSVILITIGQEGFLECSLGSVLLQDEKDWECLVINDWPEKREEIEERVARITCDPRVRVVHCPENLKPSGARNFGIEQARGKVMAFLDDDDIWMRQHLGEHRKAHERGGESCLAYSDIVTFWQGADYPVRQELLPEGKMPVAGKMRSGEFHLATVSTISISKNAVVVAGGFDPEMIGAEDHELLFRIPDECVPVRIPHLLTAYREHFREKITTGHEKVAETYQRIIRKHRVEEAQDNPLGKWMQNPIYRALLSDAPKIGLRERLRFSVRAFHYRVETIPLVKISLMALIGPRVYFLLRKWCGASDEVPEAVLEELENDLGRSLRSLT